MSTELGQLIEKNGIKLIEKTTEITNVLNKLRLNNKKLQVSIENIESQIDEIKVGIQELTNDETLDLHEVKESVELLNVEQNDLLITVKIKRVKLGKNKEQFDLINEKLLNRIQKDHKNVVDKIDNIRRELVDNLDSESDNTEEDFEEPEELNNPEDTKKTEDPKNPDNPTKPVHYIIDSDSDSD